MPGRDLPLLTEAVRDAGALALHYWNANPKTWEKPGLGPVTEADLAVNGLLATRLLAARPGYGWLSEETEDSAARLDCEHVFILDPIDGTRAFIAGERHFSVSLAVARLGKVVAAAIYLPALDRLYTATADDTARVNGMPIRPSDHATLAGSNLLISKHLLAAEHWNRPPEDLKRSFRSSIAYRLCLVAEGAFDGMVSLRDAWEWDIAAGSLIAERAGAVVTDRHGCALQFNNAGAKTAGVLAAPPALHADLIATLKV